MNKTVTVHLSGFVFNIEEVAYLQLKQYLDDIRNNLGHSSEASEIMDDIELRIAELFQEKITPSNEVIREVDIEEIISIMGRPSEFSDGEEGHFDEQYQETKQTYSQRKRLFRDKDDAVLGGVCSGLGHYFGTDPVVIRALFVLLFILFGSGVLLYLILLIIIPEAKTTSDKIEMKGQAVNLENIKEHISNFKETITDKSGRATIRRNVKDVVDRGVNVTKSTLSAFSKLIGIGAIIFGFFLLVLLANVYFNNSGTVPFIGPERIPDFTTLINIVFPDSTPTTLLFVAIVIASVVPLITLILTGIRLLSKSAKNTKPIFWGLGILWTISFLVTLYYGLGLASDFKSSKTVTTHLTTENENSDTLFVSVNNDDEFSNFIDPYGEDNPLDLIKIRNEKIIIGIVELEIEALSDSGSFDIVYKRFSTGSGVRDAIDKIKRIDYPIAVAQNKLALHPYYSFPKADKIRAQHIEVKIRVPLNKTIVFGENIDRIWRYMENDHDFYDNTYSKSTWKNISGDMYRQQ